jgi:hypothetical protein
MFVLVLQLDLLVSVSSSERRRNVGEGKESVMLIDVPPSNLFIVESPSSSI